MLYLPETAIDVIKIFTLGALGFILAFLLTPILTHFLYKYKLWRKEVRTKAIDGGEVPTFQKFHAEGETRIPRFGGLLIWVTVLILIFLFFGISQITDIWWLNKLNFLSRNQTWLPLFTLVAASLLGLADDILQVFGKGKYVGGGLSLKRRLILVMIIGLIGALWFYFRLDWSTIHIPGVGDLEINGWYIPLFVVVMMATYSGGVIDGLDGLAGGAFASIFAAFSGIALFLGQIDIAAFCAVILGALLAFLWFNIPPARFYMGETGIMGLCATLTVVAFLTDSVLVLPVIGSLLVIESGSVILQLLSKKFRHKKLFLASPIHHHFEAKNWPHYKVTMRFWIIGAVMAVIGITIRLLG
jgi:phospho-N-acetylmuramoyl-pentapeptide-transferase